MRVGTLLNESRQQLELAELLGYGKKKDFEPLYAELNKVKQKTAGGGGWKGWLDEITDSGNPNAEQESSARPHSNRSDSFDSQPQTKALSHEEQLALNKINMEKAGLKVWVYII